MLSSETNSKFCEQSRLVQRLMCHSPIVVLRHLTCRVLNSLRIHRHEQFAGVCEGSKLFQNIKHLLSASKQWDCRASAAVAITSVHRVFMSSDLTTSGTVVQLISATRGRASAAGCARRLRSGGERIIRQKGLKSDLTSEISSMR